MRVFVDWVLRLTARLVPNEEEALPPVRTLEGVKMTLEERVSQWPAQWIRQGMEQGLEHERGAAAPDGGIALRRDYGRALVGNTRAHHRPRASLRYW